jgi:cyclopropane-fatty-acyl-phospholipid synthase
VQTAKIIQPLVRTALRTTLPVRVTCWDDSSSGPSDAPLRLTINRRRALRRLLWAPNELGFVRAYISGDVDVDGSLVDVLRLLDRTADPRSGPGIVLDPATKRAMLWAILRVGAIGLPPAPPAEEIRLSGSQHSRGRDVDAIAHHYDVSNDFYALVLGSSMTYSCAYWAKDPAAGYSLDDAQRDKCELVARKLGLCQGMRVLDVGCGWGTLVLHAARRHRAHAVGVTLSAAQADFARREVAAQGLGDLVEIRVQDYRDVVDGPYDAIASVGMAEHVGSSMLPTYVADMFGLLRPGGRFLNHAIARRPGDVVTPSKTSFIDRYVFPDGELQPLGRMVSAIEDAGFEVRDVESLREHYAMTLRAWVCNLERSWSTAAALTSEGRARVWQLYMAGSALAFDAGRLGVNQVLAVKPGPHGDSGMPRTRPAPLVS